MLLFTFILLMQPQSIQVIHEIKKIRNHVAHHAGVLIDSQLFRTYQEQLNRAFVILFGSSDELMAAFEGIRISLVFLRLVHVSINRGMLSA